MSTQNRYKPSKIQATWCQDQQKKNKKLSQVGLKFPAQFAGESVGIWQKQHASMEISIWRDGAGQRRQCDGVGDVFLANSEEHLAQSIPSIMTEQYKAIRLSWTLLPTYLTFGQLYLYL